MVAALDNSGLTALAADFSGLTVLAAVLSCGTEMATEVSGKKVSSTWVKVPCSAPRLRGADFFPTPLPKKIKRLF